MLHSYQAELNGSQLIWIDQPPQALQRRRVVVVVALDDAVTAPPAKHGIQGFLDARGCLGPASRDQVLAGLDALREDWARNPLGGAQDH